MDDVPLAGEGAQLLAQGDNGVDGLGRLFLGLVDDVLGLDVLVGFLVLVGVDVLVLDVECGFLRGFARFGLGSLELVHLVSALDDVELVVHGLVRLDGVVQVLVRHGGCFFLDT